MDHLEICWSSFLVEHSGSHAIAVLPRMDFAGTVRQYTRSSHSVVGLRVGCLVLFRFGGSSAECTIGSAILMNSQQLSLR